MKKVDNGVLRIMYYLAVLFSFENFYNKKVDERKRDKALWNYMYGKNVGVSIGLAHHWFGYSYSCYPGFFSWLLLGIASRVYGDEVKGMVVMLIFSFPVALGYIPAYRAVFSKDRYLNYFKQFEKENEQWHKKWKRITWVFCIGSVVFTIGGIFAMWGVSLLFR
ncbi:MAG: hypothetical protein ACTTIF_04235 [Prevotella sp.]